MPIAPVPPHLLALRADIGRRVRAARERARLTQPQLGERMGVDWKSISRLENGLVSPRVDRLLEIALVLGVPPASLMPGGPRLPPEGTAAGARDPQ
ncbi:helix-turn-helix domain-containing protein [Streptomyces sp. URMC 129]|uniref:helix-turn-helix domain-containing protein n=1 Tax=Streptomyces sp. URMC 129 TaxID=3423407 RepID=UPI003F1AF17B